MIDLRCVDLRGIDPITRIVRVSLQIVSQIPAGNRPLLKWAGGKRQLLPALQPHYPTAFRRYIEPFLGSGAVFFDLRASGRLEGRKTWLVDHNADLVGCYRTLRDQTEAVIAALDALAAEHTARGEAFYYEIRDERFNRLRREGQPYTPELAAMLIYLNRTGFNGLFRLNSRGDFNVPAGRYVNPRICDPEHLRDVARAFGAPGVRLDHASFEVPLSAAGAGDFVYCDPPYAPLSETARFAHYTAGGFSAADQERLGEAVIGAATRGATVLLSNSSAPSIEAIYGGREARKAGLSLLRVPARRSINSRAASRGPVDELLVVSDPRLRLPGRLKMARSTGSRAAAKSRRTA